MNDTDGTNSEPLRVPLSDQLGAIVDPPHCTPGTHKWDDPGNGDIMCMRCYVMPRHYNLCERCGRHDGPCAQCEREAGA